MNHRTFKIENVIRTHDARGLPIGNVPVVRVTIDGAEPFDMQMNEAQDIALRILEWVARSAPGPRGGPTLEQLSP